ncbi:hypothetical protein NEHOM01_1666 [Nematocida homosporus]|uniref:uncharacterized protein n=1 Tax=Nematocida homosporus TaxID=1912981 RepID=UPI00221F20EF|nr:uncharacterized protein NEHOM01_1666 [Nematocida homosporus]KAI5186727.1 hypothetical protein NEHOM01_1666 [Nematocida homosporus]
MNKRLNEYSLNVYQVVCLVIGLCCVWCDTVGDLNKMGSAGPSKRSGTSRDNQIALHFIDISNAINEMQSLRNQQSIRINAIKKYQQNLKEEKHEASENMNSTQSDCSFSDKSKDRFRQKKIELLSILVREEVIQKSVNIVAQQMDQWLEESKNTQLQLGSRIKSLCKLAKIAQQLKQIKTDAMGPQSQSPDSCRSILEDGIIALGVRYNSYGLKRRIKVIIIEELKKILPRIGLLGRDNITRVVDSVIDQFLEHDELESSNIIFRIIKEALVWLDNKSKEMEVKSESKQKPTDSEPSTSRAQSSNPQTNESGMVEEALAQLDNKSKEMEVKSESKQKPTDPEPSTSRTQSSNPQTNESGMVEEALAQLDNRSKKMKVKSESESKQKPTDPEPSTSRTQSSNPQTNKSGMGGKPHSSRRSAG